MPTVFSHKEKFMILNTGSIGIFQAYSETVKSLYHVDLIYTLIVELSILPNFTLILFFFFKFWTLIAGIKWIKYFFYSISIPQKKGKFLSFAKKKIAPLNTSMVNVYLTNVYFHNLFHQSTILYKSIGFN